jgi:hypothetical protein
VGEIHIRVTDASGNTMIALSQYLHFAIGIAAFAGLVWWIKARIAKSSARKERESISSPVRDSWGEKGARGRGIR